MMTAFIFQSCAIAVPSLTVSVSRHPLASIVVGRLFTVTSTFGAVMLYSPLACSTSTVNAPVSLSASPMLTFTLTGWSL